MKELKKKATLHICDKEYRVYAYENEDFTSVIMNNEGIDIFDLIDGGTVVINVTKIDYIEFDKEEQC